MKYFALILFVFTMTGINNTIAQQNNEQPFKVHADAFADIAVLRYQVPGFEKLTLKQKTLLYYLYQAALSGRDIIYDQNFKHNLFIRRVLEGIVNGYTGDRTTDDFQKFMVYAKRVWFSNGIHHHYASSKILPEFTGSYFSGLLTNTPRKFLPLAKNTPIDSVIRALTPIMFEPELFRMRVNQAANVDVVASSANNFYEGLRQKEVEAWYAAKVDTNDPRPISLGLNSKLVKKNGKISERVWKIGGMYSKALEQMVFWLKKAMTVAENPQQKKVLGLLVKYYKTGDLRVFNEYCIEWVKDTESFIDITHGFIETYGDPLNYKATYESVLSFRDVEASKRIDAISKAAQWFENHSPIAPEYKKKDVKGISAKVITVVVEAGDASPATPIGINLPNAPWIRKEFGSKSVNLGNIVHAYNQASGGEVLKEFAFSEEEAEIARIYGTIADDLHTDLHEVIGHASGQLKPGVGTPRESLKNFASTIEEARADLVALYFIYDAKLVELGVMPAVVAGRAAYDKYIRNGLLVQLQRIKPGEKIEEAHMRNRALIANWALEQSRPEKIIEQVRKDGKTYFVIRDYEKLREIFGKLLKEVQRISSEGDYAAAKQLVERYGIQVDEKLHAEVLSRFEKLNVAPYKGFINPVLVPVMKKGKIADVRIEYPDNFTEQMLHYGKHYSFLPNNN